MFVLAGGILAVAVVLLLLTGMAHVSHGRLDPFAQKLLVVSIILGAVAISIFRKGKASIDQDQVVTSVPKTTSIGDLKQNHYDLNNKRQSQAQPQQSARGAALPCQSCGHVSAPEAAYCENCAAPLNALEAPAPRQPYVEDLREDTRRAAPTQDKVNSQTNVTGVVQSLYGGGMRVIPDGAGEGTIDIKFPALKVVEIAQRVQVGDHIQVTGKYNVRGTFEPKGITNLRTHVVVMKPTYALQTTLLLLCLVVVLVFIMAIFQRHR